MAVDGDFEFSPARGGQGHIGAEAVLQSVPRTEGIGLVVSHHAIFDINLHLLLLF